MRRFWAGVLFLCLGARGEAYARPHAQPRPLSQAEQQVQAEQDRLAAIEKLKLLLQNPSVTGELRAELLFRLAEVYFEEGRSIYLDNIDIYVRQVDHCFNTPDCPLARMVELAPGTPLAWQWESIKVYQEIIRDYPSYTRKDDVLFFMGLALNEVGQPEESLSAFKQLLLEYPSSVHLADTYMLIGEYYFDRNDAYKALLAYQHAAAFKNADRYNFAVYKLAWCYYNVGDYDTAIQNMLLALTSSPPSVQPYIIEDLARFYADVGEFTSVIYDNAPLLRSDLMLQLLPELAKYYEAAGKFDSAIVTWRRLITQNPTQAQAMDYQDHVVGALVRMGDAQKTLEAIEYMLQMYGEHSAWAMANADNPALLALALARVEAHLRQEALNDFGLTKKTASATTVQKYLLLSERAFLLYFQEFPDSEYALEMHSSFADLSYVLRKYDQAYAHYRMYLAHTPAGVHAEYCARSAILAAESMRQREEPSLGASLSYWERQQLAAIDQFIGMFPDHPDVQGLIYQAGLIFYHKQNFQSALLRFQQVVALNPLSSNAEAVAYLMVSDPHLQDTKDPRLLAQVALSFSQNFPQSPHAAQALSDAAMYFHQAHHIREAIAVEQALLDNFPSSEYAIKHVVALGDDYASLGEFAQAAFWYEYLATLDLKHPSTPTALRTAGRFRAALGDVDLAIHDLTLLTMLDPTLPDRNRLILKIADLYVEQNRWLDAAKIYFNFFQSPPPNATFKDLMFCRLQYGRALMQWGQSQRVRQHWQETITWAKTQKAAGINVYTGADAYAQVLFLWSEADFQNYMALQMQGPSEALLTKQIIVKTKALDALEKQAIEILEMNSKEWVVAALLRLGLAYENMLETLVHATPTDGMYRLHMYDMVYPSLEKAIHIYELALHEAFMFSIYNDTARQALHRLEVLRPNDYLPFYETLPAYTPAAISIMPIETSLQK